MIEEGATDNAGRANSNDRYQQPVMAGIGGAASVLDLGRMQPIGAMAYQGNRSSCDQRKSGATYRAFR